jgi:hypothetical protein
LDICKNLDDAAYKEPLPPNENSLELDSSNIELKNVLTNVNASKELMETT